MAFEKLVKWVCVIFILCLIPIGIGVWLMLYDGYEDLFNTGVKTEAIVDEFSYRSNSKINDVSMYYIEYSFFDENGQSHKGKTSPSYTYSEIEEIIKNEKVEIIYDSNTFESIETSYDKQKDFDYRARVVGAKMLFSVFGMVECFAIIFAFVLIRVYFRFNVWKKGDLYNAHITKIYKLQEHGDNIKVRLLYTWIGAMGQEREGSTKFKGTVTEIKKLKDDGYLTIKVLGEKIEVFEFISPIFKKILHANGVDLPSKYYLEENKVNNE